MKIVFVLDKSGSMSGLEKDVIGGFNSFISEQKKLKDKARVTTVLFDTQYKILHDNVDLHKMEPITPKQYYTDGGTALLDALGKTIRSVEAKCEKNEKVLFIINTDGEENSSHEFNNQQIKDMVTHNEHMHDWKFIFLGANIDSFSTGGNLGITYNFNYQNTSKGIHHLYAAVSDTTRTWRNTSGQTVDTTSLTNLDDSNVKQETTP